MDFYQEARQFVNECFVKAGKTSPTDLQHFERTVYWLKQLKPDADEAICIAAYAHDLERAFRDHATDSQLNAHPLGFLNPDRHKYHSEKGAAVISEFLEKLKAPQEMIDRVKSLILFHEIGGNQDQNLLKDADSISYFENNVEWFVTERVKKLGKEKIREKVDWMFQRITSEKAKDIARPWYEEGIKKLGY